MMQALIAVGVDGRAVMLQHHDEGPHVGLWRDSDTLDPIKLDMDDLPERVKRFTLAFTAKTRW